MMDYVNPWSLALFPSSLSSPFINVILSWYWWELFIPQTWYLLCFHITHKTLAHEYLVDFLVIYELHSDHIFPTHFFLVVKCSLVFALRICFSLLVWLYYFWWMIKWTFRKPWEWWAITLFSGGKHSHVWTIWLIFSLYGSTCNWYTEFIWTFLGCE